MTGDLMLAVDISEAIAKAANDPGIIDIEAEAAALVEAHPEADATQDEVAQVLIEEGVEAGVIPPKPSEF